MKKFMSLIFMIIIILPVFSDNNTKKEQIWLKDDGQIETKITQIIDENMQEIYFEELYSKQNEQILHKGIAINNEVVDVSDSFGNAEIAIRHLKKDLEKNKEYISYYNNKGIPIFENINYCPEKTKREITFEGEKMNPDPNDLEGMTYLNSVISYYDDNNNLIAQENSGEDENINSLLVCEYNKNNKISKEYSMSKYGSTITKYSYNINNKVSKIVTYSFTSRVLREEFYNYNEDNNLSNKICKNYENNITSEYVYSYKNDSDLSTVLVYDNDKLITKDIYTYNPYNKNACKTITSYEINEENQLMEMTIDTYNSDNLLISSQMGEDCYSRYNMTFSIEYEYNENNKLIKEEALRKFENTTYLYYYNNNELIKKIETSTHNFEENKKVYRITLYQSNWSDFSIG